ncbi:MAG: hypothetical protein MPW13_15090 [Candidatus Manganitrophus sp.]|nr:hypothetical protein [Candidatus Manganitrophus sp.]
MPEWIAAVFQDLSGNYDQRRPPRRRHTRSDPNQREVRSHLQIDVKDNGRGITPEEMADPKSLGLLGIRERMLLLAGETEINGVPQKGTDRLKIPLQEAEGASVSIRSPGQRLNI